MLTLLGVFVGTIATFAQCDGDHHVAVYNYEIHPSELTIQVGESVSFTNYGGWHSINGETMLILATRVDDLLYVARLAYCSMVEALLARFEVKETKEGKFRCCGREYEQCITARGHTETTKPINFVKGSRTAESPASDGGDITASQRQWQPQLDSASVPTREDIHLPKASGYCQHC